MRQIFLEEDLRLRFPQRSSEFDEGVEVGMMAALMALRHPVITRWVSGPAVEQLKELAPRLGYRAAFDADMSVGATRVTLTTAALRPKLRLVGSS